MYTYAYPVERDVNSNKRQQLRRQVEDFTETKAIKSEIAVNAIIHISVAMGSGDFRDTLNRMSRLYEHCPMPSTRAFNGFMNE